MPTILTILYWVILVISFVFSFAPPSWGIPPRYGALPWIALFIIIGLKIFKTPVQ